MENTISHICIYSYNTRGSSETKLKFIKDMIEIPQRNSPIFCIQEHFLLRNNVYKLSKAFKNYAVLVKPAYKNFNVQDMGRPMGGLATIIPKGWRKNTTILSSQSWRIQPLLIKLKKKSILVINSYFPTDPRTVGGENIELENVLAEISNIISSNHFDSLYLVGDLNCNFLRNSSHVETTKEFMTNLNMYSLWRDFPVDFTHTFQNENKECFMNTLDHILTLTGSSSNVVDAGVLHLVENMSDHEPIYTVIKVEHEAATDDEDPSVKAKPKPNWKDASSDQKLEYNDELFRKLSYMNVPVEITECTNVHCEDIEH
jgi:exonuclease III